MPVTAAPAVNRYTGNGATTVFAYGFRILAATDLEVSLGGVVQSTGFTVSGVNAPGGGNVTFSVAPGSGVAVTLRRLMAYARSTDYQVGGDLLESTLDADQDAPVMMIQQLAEAVGRTLQLPTTSSLTGLTVPVPVAAQYLRWNAGETGLENATLVTSGAIGIPVPISQGGTNATTAADARTALGAVASGAVTASGLTQATARLLGRTTGGVGPVEAISVGSNLTLAGLSLNLATNPAIGAATATTQPLTTNNTTVATTAFVQAAALGNTQTWQNLTGSRAANTVYTNSTSQTIAIAGNLANVSGGDCRVFVNGNQMDDYLPASGAPPMKFFMIVPPGATYEVRSTGSFTLARWWELRA